MVGSSDLTKYWNKFEKNIQIWLFLGYVFICCKVPMWPFHTWLPGTHVEAPTAGSIILAGIY